MRERGKERGPLDGSLRSEPDLTFFHAFAALSRNITEFTAVLGAPTGCRRVRRDGNDMVDTLCCQRDTDFVAGMPMTLRHGTCDREVEMTPPTLTAAATAEVDVRASA
jgi:hypothetical protein